MFSSSPIYFQLWFSCRISFERSLRFRNRFRLSVCTTIFKRIAGLRYCLKSLMLYINVFASTSSTNYWKAFFKFWILFSNYRPKTIQTERRGYWSKCNVLFINGLVSTCFKNLWNLWFSNYGIIFELVTIF